MHCIINGGDLVNKGAQSMTFIVMNEFLKRYPNDSVILLTPCSDKQEVYKPYRIEPFTVHIKSVFYGLGIGAQIISKFKKVDVKDVKRLEDLFKKARMYVDISGYVLGSNWSTYIVRYYLCMIHYAHRHNVPVFVMPQSFGPFDYAFPKSLICNWYIHKVMQYPAIIYAREKEGYVLLRKKYGLTNVKRSYDMVLMSGAVELNNIYTSDVKMRQEYILPDSVAIIPNIRVLDKIDEDSLLDNYLLIGKKLIEKGKTIYILRHSEEDEVFVRQVSCYLQKNNVENHLLETDFNCIEYECIVEKFSFIIASRYHAIVHAYRKGTPCIAIGWAVKYKDLLAALAQEQYAIDISAMDKNQLIDSIKQMCERYREERKIILKRVEKICRRNIFDIWSNLEKSQVKEN